MSLLLASYMHVEFQPDRTSKIWDNHCFRRFPEGKMQSLTALGHVTINRHRREGLRPCDEASAPDCFVLLAWTGIGVQWPSACFFQHRDKEYKICCGLLPSFCLSCGPW